MNARTIAIVVVLGGAAYLWFYKRPELDATLNRLLGSGNGWSPETPTGALAGSAYAPTTTTPLPTAPSTTQKIIGASTAIGAALVPTLVGGGSAAGAGAGATGAAGAGAGISTAAAITAAGIAAGAAILAWGIITKGWFRGGEEGIKVNPARDAFLQEFNTQYGLVRTDTSYESLVQGFQKAVADVGMPGYEADRLQRRINAAETMTEWNDAANDAANTFEAYSAIAGIAGYWASDTRDRSGLPLWRQRQLRGEVVFADGRTPAEELAAAQAQYGITGDKDYVRELQRGF